MKTVVDDQDDGVQIVGGRPLTETEKTDLQQKFPSVDIFTDSDCTIVNFGYEYDLTESINTHLKELPE
jgi:hypothetical protein